jgi:hypothetical protein
VERFVPVTLLADKCLALFRKQFERCIEDWLELAPPVG